MALLEDAVMFGALCVALTAGAVWRWRHVEDAAAAHGYRGGVWLLAVAGGGLALRIGGVV